MPDDALALFLSSMSSAACQALVASAAAAAVVVVAEGQRPPEFCSDTGRLLNLRYVLD